MNTLNSSMTSFRAQPRLLVPAHRRDCPRQVLRPAALKPVASPAAVADGLTHPALRAFVQAIFDEPECRRLLDAPVQAGGVFVVPLLKRLHAAAWSTALYPSSSRLQSQVMYAATLVLGMQNLLKAASDEGLDGVLSNSAVSDVFFAICHPALRRLESQAPVHAALLRIALNWGNVDEMMDEQAQRMQSIVRQASRVCAGRLTLKKRARFTSNGEVAHG